MNCKQGDLAIIVKSYAGNEGKIVRCVRFLGSIRFIYIDNTIIELDSWEIDIEIKGICGDVYNKIPDSYLRPIRDSNKEDEMLSIVSLKEKVKS